MSDSGPNMSLVPASRDLSPVPTFTKAPPTRVPLTPQEARTLEVSEALRPAYEKASTLDLSDSEIAQLTELFPDDKVEIRPHDGLCFISHIHISDRLNRVFRPGKWALICRREWVEGTVAYAQYVLVIRGCYVGESFGGHPYIANNPKTNWADAMESTAAEALRRIAAKRLSCGSQVWDKSYTEAWISKYAACRGGKWYKKSVGQDATESDKRTQPSSSTPAQQSPPQTSVDRPTPTAATRAWFLKKITDAEAAQAFFEQVGALMPTEKLEDLPLQFAPNTGDEATKLLVAIAEFKATGTAAMPFSLHADAPIEPDEMPDLPFFKVVVHVPPKGMKRKEYLQNPDTIGSLYEKRKTDKSASTRLFGFASNYQPTGWTKPNGEQVPPTAEDKALREALDQFLSWFKETHPNEKL